MRVTGETEVFVEISVTMLLCSPQIPHGLGCSDAIPDARAQSQAGGNGGSTARTPPSFFCPFQK